MRLWPPKYRYEGFLWIACKIHPTLMANPSWRRCQCCTCWTNHRHPAETCHWLGNRSNFIALRSRANWPNYENRVICIPNIKGHQQLELTKSSTIWGPQTIPNKVPGAVRGGRDDWPQDCMVECWKCILSALKSTGPYIYIVPLMSFSIDQHDHHWNGGIKHFI